MKAVILAAGVGSRIGSPKPKCLTMLPIGKTILENQISILKACGISEIVVVVGFKKEWIMETDEKVLYAYNPSYHITNTSKSLLKALERIEPDDVVWINGDVCLEHEIVNRVSSREGNIIAVNNAACGEEEVKYRVNHKGAIAEISKRLQNPEGEAVGINKITRADFPVLVECLRMCADNDYFEKGIELSIKRSIQFYPLDISDLKCIEVDFEEDLERAIELFS